MDARPPDISKTIVDPEAGQFADQAHASGGAPDGGPPRMGPANPFAPPVSASGSGAHAQVPSPASSPQPVGVPPYTPPAGMPPGQPQPQPGAPAGVASPAPAGAPQGGAVPSVPSGVPAAGGQPLARLVSVQRDGSDGAVHEICDESFDLGRNAGHLTFEDDPYLSERHCRLIRAEGTWRVQDLSSLNGIYLKIKQPVALQDGDHLLLGKQVMRFDAIDEADVDVAPAVEHGVMLFGAPLVETWGCLRQLTVAGTFRDVHYLCSTQLTVGREEGGITFPTDEFMSRKHMAVTRVNGKAQVQDLGSSNGTYLRVHGRAELSPGDMLRVGDQLLRFELA